MKTVAVMMLFRVMLSSWDGEGAKVAVAILIHTYVFALSFIAAISCSYS
jgi:hypothetical protein